MQVGDVKKRIHLVDTTLRDGSHAVLHEFTLDNIKDIVKGLDESGIDFIEIGHGDGLSGSSQNYGWSLFGDEEVLGAAASVIGNESKLTVLLIPGIGTVEDLKTAYKTGVKAARIATHVTEADIGEQHIKMCKDMGLTAFGFLMMSHMAGKKKIVEQAKLFESYGADIIYMADSAGAMLPAEVKEKTEALVGSISVPIGFHAHNNLGLSAANSIAALEGGATYLDGSLRGLGAGSGNAQTEVLVAILKRQGYTVGADLYKTMDAAEEIVQPIMRRPQVIDKSSLTLGYAGVYSSFLIHTERAAKRFNLDPRDILLELGKRRMVGGQEDMIIDVAYQLSQKSGK
ncbi:MAG: 4-hydroxy-2-oxovalerate aldolase [Firmicutes bacterium]|nr:4-hydroxy-2-oxovalerate aldolase [Bacillota bacterium]